MTIIIQFLDGIAAAQRRQHYHTANGRGVGIPVAGANGNGLLRQTGYGSQRK